MSRRSSQISMETEIVMGSVREYLAIFSYDFELYFSGDVQTTTIAVALTGSLCCSILWVIINYVSLAKNRPIKCKRKGSYGRGCESSVLTENRGQHSSKPKADTFHFHVRPIEVLCARCGSCAADLRCSFVMCSACCIGRSTCLAHQDRSRMLENIEKFKPRQIDLSHKKIQKCPSRLGYVGAQLTCLNLSHNNLQCLSPDIGCLRWLKELNLANNMLTELPDSISSMESLTELHLKNNRMASLSESLDALSVLRYLDVSENDLITLPGCITKLVSLEEVHLGCNRLTELPHDLGKLFNLKVLNISQNLIVALPVSIGNLRQLSHLFANNCLLTRLPSSITQCACIIKLQLNHNRLTFLPNRLGQMQQLKELHVSGNRLRYLPTAIYEMSAVILSASRNNFIQPGDFDAINATRMRPSGRIPPLLELSARCISRNNIEDISNLPQLLKDLLHQEQQCSHCGQPVFVFCLTVLEFVSLGMFSQLPLVTQLCSVQPQHPCVVHRYNF